MCLSTVYIYAHYAIDAIAGLVTGCLFYLMLIALWQRHS
jgi:membrane-associated phospholipid phosphatase